MTIKMTTRAAALIAGAFALFSAGAQAQTVLAQNDGVIRSSLCVGLDCPNSISFGFDTIRLMENNTRITFDDTSNSGSFPNRHWTIVANDSTNGGGNYLAFQDVSTGRLTFRVDADAPDNALRVNSSGDIGIGTANPVVELHAVDGNSPALRLEQNGSSGFQAQTWDVAGNEANFFVRDVTNGSRLPFKIVPGAPTNALYVAADGDVGMGTASPEAGIHVRRDSSGGFAPGLLLENNGGTGIFMANTAAENGVRWRMAMSPIRTELLLVTPDNPGDEFELTTTGDVRILGNFISAGQTLTVPDYVFEADYDLRSLAEVQAFIDENGHLPNVPSASEIAANGVNVSEMQMLLLEKVEELTLYTLAQQEQIDALSVELASARQ